MTQRIYNTSDSLEVDRIRKIKDFTKFYKLIIHESKLIVIIFLVIIENYQQLRKFLSSLKILILFIKNILNIKKRLVYSNYKSLVLAKYIKWNPYVDQ